MQILPEQVALELRVDDAHPLVKALKTAGAKKPKIMLVFDENAAGTDWVVHIFYQSPTELREVRLDVPVLLMETRIEPDGEEVIKATYPSGYIGVCGVIGGKKVWIT